MEIDVVNGLVVEVVKVSILVVFISTIVGVVGGFVIDVYSGIDVVGRILSVVCYEAHWFSFVVSLIVVVGGGCFWWFSRSSMSCKSQYKLLYSS